jgi:hypothetical protein
MVSVIIPNYNHADYLPDAIDSVLQQEYDPVEIIVVDDGSTDHSGQVAERYGDRIRYIWQENQGLSAARNTGLRAAHGEYIALLDADDMLEPTFMTTLVGALADNAQADGAICGYRFVDDDDNPLSQSESRQIDPDELYGVLLDGNFLVPESILVRRHCYDAVGPFDESLRASEDWDMWLRISRRFTILTIPQLLTRHRVLPGSMSSDPQRMLTNRLTVLTHHFGSKPGDAQSGTPTQRRAFARAYLTSAVEYLGVSAEQEARACLLEIANLHPALLTELDTYYRLICSGQAKGNHGNLEMVNLPQKSQQVLQILHDLLTAGAAPPSLHREAQAVANDALGMVAYGKGQLNEARRYYWRAFLAYPGYAKQGAYLSRWARAFIGSRRLRHFRNRIRGNGKQ